METNPMMASLMRNFRGLRTARTPEDREYHLQQIATLRRMLYGHRRVTPRSIRDLAALRVKRPSETR